MRASIRFGLALILVAAAVLSLRQLDGPRVLEALRAAKLGYLLLALGLDFAYLAARGFRWWLLLRHGGRSFTLRAATRISTLGVFMATVFPPLGEASRLVLLRRRRVPTGRAVALVIVERLGDAATLALFLLVGLDRVPSPRLPPVAPFAPGLPTLVGGALVLAGPLVAIGGRRAIGAARRWQRALARLAAFSIDGVKRTSADARRSPLTAVAIGLLTLAVNGLGAAIGWVAVLAFLPHLPATAAMLFTAVAYFGLAVFPSPLGLGPYQLAGVTVLGSYGASQELAVAAATGVQAVNCGATLLGALLAAPFELVATAPSSAIILQRDELGPPGARCQPLPGRSGRPRD